MVLGRAKLVSNLSQCQCNVQQRFFFTEFSPINISRSIGQSHSVVLNLYFLTCTFGSNKNPLRGQNELEDMYTNSSLKTICKKQFIANYARTTLQPISKCHNFQLANHTWYKRVVIPDVSSNIILIAICKACDTPRASVYQPLNWQCCT